MNAELEQAIRAIEAGDLILGRRLLIKILQTEPYTEDAWLWMSRITEGNERRDCLERVLKINPNNQYAQRSLADLQQASDTGLTRDQQVESLQAV